MIDIFAKTFLNAAGFRDHDRPTRTHRSEAARRMREQREQENLDFLRRYDESHR